MSRRITVFLLAATASLIATQAFADRECFENSCRLPEVVEPPPAAPAASAEDSQASADRAVHELAAEPAARTPSKGARHAAKPAAPTKPMRLAPAYPKANPMPAHEAASLREASSLREAGPRREPSPESASYARPARLPVAERAYAGHETRTGGALIINVPAPTYGTEGVAATRPYVFYTDNHAPRLYVLAPNAKIISVDDGD